VKKGFLVLLLSVSNHLFAIHDSSHVPRVFAEILVWQVGVVSDNNWGQLLGPTGTYQQNKFLNIPFDWSPGLRVGVGRNTHESPWNVLFYYTGYQTEGRRQVSTTEGEIHSAFLGNFFAQNLSGNGLSGPYYKTAGITWDVIFHSFDLELGRSILIDKLVNIRPFVGLKAGVIKHAIKTHWQQPFDDKNKTPIHTFSSAQENIHNNFKGVGPSFGLDSVWYLHHTPTQSFNLIGNFSGAFLRGRWDITDVYRNNTPVSITIQNDKMTSMASTTRGYLGIEWAKAFNQANIAIRIGYEGQVWFNQLKYYSFDMGRTSDALFFHGGIVGVSYHA
jgi:Legionella pneumophila major outer membrane protein precursor